MDAVEKITLIKRIATTDDIGELVYEETEKTIYCMVQSVSQNEWFQANRADIQAAYKVSVYAFEYDGEDIAEYHGTRYKIYRVYVRDALNVELYLEKRVGVE